MRNPSFRVWDSKRKEWVHGPGKEPHLIGETVLGGGFLCRPDDHHVSIMDYNDMVILQETGLLIDGKMSYEGDIVDGFIETGGNYLEPPKYEQYRVVVEWDDQYVRFVFRDVYSGDVLSGDDAPEFEKIVGNIYDNPNKIEEPFE